MMTKHYWPNRIDPETKTEYGPKAIVLHITDGSSASTLNWIKDPRSYVSYNYIVDEQGKVIEVVDPRHAAWASGRIYRPTWSELDPEVNPNLYTISVALANSGGVPNWLQWKAWAELCRTICRDNGWPMDEKHVVEHREINSAKRCPAPYGTRFYLKLLQRFV